MLNDIKIVLCQTSHPGNIGAAARAMKTMGLQHLVLIQPKHFPSEEAFTRSSGAREILENAVVVDSMQEAIKDCRLVIGTSSRNRYLPWPLVEPKAMADIIKQKTQARPVAIVFGRENTGLLNEELQLCHYHVNIPANPDYMSLNLAAAVQVIAYELRCASLSLLDNEQDEAQVSKKIKDSEQYANAEQVDGLYQHMESLMVTTKFYDPNQPKLLPSRLRRLLAKAQLNNGEVNILRGFLSSVDKKLKQ